MVEVEADKVERLSVISDLDQALQSMQAEYKTSGKSTILWRCQIKCKALFPTAPFEITKRYSYNILRKMPFAPECTV